MNASIEFAAARILQRMQETYGKPSTRWRVDESAFTNLDLGAYRRIRADLDAAGFAFLQDVALLEVNDSPTTLIAPTMIRSLVSSDGRIVAAYYQVRPRWKRLWGKVLTGLKNGRWFDAPMLLVRMGRTRHCVEFSSELSDGRFLSSSNAEAAERVGMPAELDRKFHKNGTSWHVLLAEHRDRLTTALARGGMEAVVSRTAEDMEARFERESALKRAHRARIGWITHDELLKMSGGNVAMANAVHVAIRAQLGASASALGSSSVGEFAKRGGGAAAND
jgi:hypothetical protein